MFFVVELTDGFGGVLEGGVIDIDDDLGNDSSDFAVLVFTGEGIVDGLGEPVADLTLAHSDGGFEGHSGSFIGGGGLLVDEDIADLRAVTVSDDDFIFAGEGGDNCANDARDLFLSCGGDFAVFL